MKTWKIGLGLLLCLMLLVCLVPAAYAGYYDEVDFAALEQAIATAQGKIIVEGILRIERDLVIPQDVELQDQNGRVIVPEGVTVTVNGSLHVDELELYGTLINNNEVKVYWQLTLPEDNISRHIIINPGSVLLVDSRFWPESFFELDYSAGQLVKRIEVFSSQELLSALGSAEGLDYSVEIHVRDSFAVPFGNTVTVPANCILELHDNWGELSLSAGVDMRVDGELDLNGGSFTAPGAFTNNGNIWIGGGSFTASRTLTNNGIILIEGGSFTASGTITNYGRLRLKDDSNHQTHLTATGVTGTGVIDLMVSGMLNDALEKQALDMLDVPDKENIPSARMGRALQLYPGEPENIYDELAAMIASGRQDLDFTSRRLLTLPESGSITIPAGSVSTFTYSPGYYSTYLIIPEGFNLIVEGELNLSIVQLDGQITAQNGGRVYTNGLLRKGENGRILVNNAYGCISRLPDEGLYIIEGDSQVDCDCSVGNIEGLNTVMNYVAPDEHITVNAVLGSDMTVNSGTTLAGDSTKVIVPENVTLTVKGSFIPKELEVQKDGSLVVDCGSPLIRVSISTLTIDGNMTLNNNSYVNTNISSYERLQTAHTAGRITFNGSSGLVYHNGTNNPENVSAKLYETKSFLDQLVDTTHMKAVVDVACHAVLTGNIDVNLVEIEVVNGGSLTVQGKLKANGINVQKNASLVVDGLELSGPRPLTVNGNLTLNNTWVNVPIASYESLIAANEAGRITYNGNSGFYLNSDSYNASELDGAVATARTIFVGLGKRATPVLNVHFDWTIGPEEDYSDLNGNINGIDRGAKIVVKPKYGTSQGSTLTIKGTLNARWLEIDRTSRVVVDGGHLNTLNIAFGGTFRTNTWVDTAFGSADNVYNALQEKKITFVGDDAGFTFHRVIGDPAMINELFNGAKAILDRFGTERTQAVAQIACDAVITEDMDFDLGEGRIEIFSGRPNFPNGLTIQGKLKAQALKVKPNASLILDGGDLQVSTLTWETPPVADAKLPAGLTAIESEAFSGGSFNSVFIPAGVTSIADDAFGTRESLTVMGKLGSYAQTFAKARGFLFIPTAA